MWKATCVSNPGRTRIRERTAPSFASSSTRSSILRGKTRNILNSKLIRPWATGSSNRPTQLPPTVSPCRTTAICSSRPHILPSNRHTSRRNSSLHSWHSRKQCGNLCKMRNSNSLCNHKRRLRHNSKPRLSLHNRLWGSHRSHHSPLHRRPPQMKRSWTTCRFDFTIIHPCQVITFQRLSMSAKPSAFRRTRPLTLCASCALSQANA